MPRIGSYLGVITLVALTVSLPAQTVRRIAARPPSEAPAAITRVRVLLANQGPPAVEVTSTRPVTPLIQKVDNPLRLVIDLPNTVMSVRSKRIEVKSDQVSDVRLDQYQDRPPTVRIVVDLLKPADYNSNTAGNILTVRLKQASVAVASQPAPLPTTPAFTKGVEPAMVPLSPGANGAIVMAGSRLANGAAVSAGADTAILKLTRGGEMRLCPQTTVSVTQSKNGRDLMVAMSTGALETHYRSGQDADAILTPDFRMLLAGPGDFHYAISADARGNTCVRSLPGNTGSIIVSELMGEGSYRVKPPEQVVFRSGKLTDPDTNLPANCGCPPPPVPVMRAANDAAPTVPESKVPENLRLARPEDEDKPVTVPPPHAAPQSNAPAAAAPVTMTVSRESAPLPASGANDVHVRVEAPFVFRAEPGVAPPAPVEQAAQLPVVDARRMQPPPPTVTPVPPSQKQPQEHHGFLGKVKGLFSSVFH